MDVFRTVGLPHTNYEAEVIESCARIIARRLDAETTVTDLENLWNNNLTSLLMLESDHFEHKEYVARFDEEHFFLIPKLYFAVLSVFMRDDDTLELEIPAELYSSLFMVGWRQKAGKLIVKGDAGSIGDEAHGNAEIMLNGNAGSAGRDMSGNAQLTVKGDVRDAAHHAHGNAIIKIYGNVGHAAGIRAYESARCEIYGDVSGEVALHAKDSASFYVDGDAATDLSKGIPSVGYASGDVSVHVTGNVDGGIGIEATDNVTIQIDGDAGNNVGYGARKNAKITILGNAGNCVGEKAQGKVHIEVHGDAGKNIGKRAYRKASIIIKGKAEPGIPNKSFSGVLSINGKKVY